MKLLICTQVMDKNHPILGFFHRWVEEFAKHCEVLHVICLYEGEHNLPANVHVHSLGKEKGESRVKYLVRFYSLAWKLRKEYDSVFVHMNQIYVIVGAPLWKVFGKKIGLWYMHRSVPSSLKIAEKLTDVIFTGSKESFRIQSKKVQVTGHGIDTAHFAPQDMQKKFDLITVGRISRSKNLHTLLDIFAEIRSQQKITLTIVGEPLSDNDRKYKEELEKKIADLGLTNSVTFIGALSQQELPSYLNRSKVFVHTAQNGSLDKAILESLAVGIPVITMAEGSASLPLGDWLVLGKDVFIEKVKEVLQSDTKEQTQILRMHIEYQHSLFTLIPKILELY